MIGALLRRRRERAARAREDARGLRGAAGTFEVGVRVVVRAVSALDAERDVAEMVSRLVMGGEIDAGLVETVARSYVEIAADGT